MGFFSRSSFRSTPQPAVSLIEAAPRAAERGDVIALNGAYGDYYGICTATNPATGRARIYFFDTVWNVWRDLWVNRDRLTVLIPDGAVSVLPLFPLAEVQ